MLTAQLLLHFLDFTCCRCCSLLSVVHLAVAAGLVADGDGAVHMQHVSAGHGELQQQWKRRVEQSAQARTKDAPETGKQYASKHDDTNIIINIQAQDQQSLQRHTAVTAE
jgi:hypothetical protein